MSHNKSNTEALRTELVRGRHKTATHSHPYGFQLTEPDVSSLLTSVCDGAQTALGAGLGADQRPHMP